MGIKRIDPDRARELIDQGSGFTYLDVRTEDEFQDGHVPGAKNLPYFVRGPGGAGLQMNDEFLESMRKNFEPDSKIIVGCMKGGRSNKACQLLAQEGYTNLHDMRGGYLGETDPFGKILFPGWTARGFPTSTEHTTEDCLR